MSSIVLFISPKPFIKKVASVGTEFVPIVGPMVKFTTKASKITKITNPVTAASRGVGLVVISCTGPIIKYPALCALWGTTAVVGGITVNPVLIGASLEFSEMILEEVFGE